MRLVIFGVVVAAFGPLLFFLNLLLVRATAWATGAPFAPFHPIFIGLSYLSIWLVPIGLVISVIAIALMVQRPFPDGEQ